MSVPAGNNRLMVVFLLLLVCGISTRIVQAQIQTPDIPGIIHKYLKAQVKVKQFSGVVLLAHSDGIHYQEAFGESNQSLRIQNNKATVFQIGSNTKQFTAACILKLAEQSKLSLQDRLSKFIPDFPGADSVTIHMLLSHSSGIVNYTDLDEYWDAWTNFQGKPASFIALIKDRPFDFTPGTKCSYSNSGYYLLGMVIEKASGQTYADYLRNQLLIPAGINNTGLGYQDSGMSLIAKGYSREKGSFKNAQQLSINTIWSAGGLYSTVDDLVKWTQMLHSGKILKESSVRIMTSPQAVTDKGETFGYGLLIDSVKKHPRIWHDGSIPGFSSYIAYHPAEKLCIVVLSNNSFRSDVIGAGIASLIYTGRVEFPYVHKAIVLPESDLSKFTGAYQAAIRFDIVLKDGKLYRRRIGAGDLELKPETRKKLFFTDDSDRQLEFSFSKNGAVEKVVMVESGNRSEIKKL